MPALLLTSEPGHVIEFEALRGKSDEFIVKALCITTFTIGGSQPTTSVFTFKPPYRSDELTSKARCTNAWLLSNKNFQRWDDGFLPYSSLDTVLRGLQGELYVKGTEKADFVYEIVQRPVHELTEMGCPKIEDLVPRLDASPTSICAKSEGFAIWCQTNFERHPVYMF